MFTAISISKFHHPPSADLLFFFKEEKNRIFSNFCLKGQTMRI